VGKNYKGLWGLFHKIFELIRMTFNTKTLSSAFRILLYLVLLTLPLLIPSWHGKLLVLLGLVWIFLLKRKRVAGVFKGNLHSIFILLLILLQFIGLFFSGNTKSGLATIESLSPLLILPLIIFSSEKIIDTKFIQYALVCFVTGVIVLNLASLTFISHDLWDAKNLQSNIIIANNSIVQIHPAFVSLYLSFCIFFLVDQYFPLEKINRSKLGWILFSLVILITYLVWINSRTGILSFCITFLFYSFYRFKSKARIISFSALTIFFLIIFSVPFSRERFFNTPKLALSGEVSVNSGDPNMYPLTVRKQIFDCSIDLLKGPEFFYGYGTGDFRDEIRDCYQEKGYTYAYQKNLDSHNEYFAQLHRHGIIGLFLFLMLLFIPFRQALKYKSPLLAVFIILFAMTALFENVFSAQKGVTFFALICPLLMLLAKQQSQPKVAQTQLV